MTCNGAINQLSVLARPDESPAWRGGEQRLRLRVTIVLLAVAVALALAQTMSAGATEASTPAGGRLPIAASSWGYQLQEFNLSALAASAFDLLVIDYSRTGDESGELTPAQIDALRTGPCGERAVLAYLSIGEAESYRYYFDASWLDADGDPGAGAPTFLGPTNPDWEGNYKARYWLRAWQRLLFGNATAPDKSYLDRVIDAGFDGVYLDIVDAYEFWGPSEIGGNDERRRAPADMVKLVRRLAKYARKTRGAAGFLVVPQNGAGIIDPESYPDAANPDKEADRQQRAYFKSIDGIGAEDTFYFGNRDENNGLDPQQFTIDLLDVFAAADKTVLAIDYLTQQSKIDRFWELASDRGYVPYVSRRELDRLTIRAGHAPACG